MKIENTHKSLPGLLILTFILLAGIGAAEAKGRKYGLFVGINNYPEPINKLSGCVNDVKNMQSAMVAKFGFLKTDTTVLTDGQATRSGIINKIKNYEKIAGPGDLFLFHYSGHGTLFPDEYSEEQDETEEQYVAIKENGRTEVLYPRGKYDSAIVPVDVRSESSGKPWRNLILDDELYAMFSAFTKKGVQVVFISDSCHSGTVARAGKSDFPVRFTPLHKAFRVKSFDDLNLKKPEKTGKGAGEMPTGNLYLTLTGARDNEFSLDGGGGGKQRMGLFTSTLLKNLDTRGAALRTYEKLMKTVSSQVSATALKLENDQNPQLDDRFGDRNMKIFSLPSVVSSGGK